MVENRKRHSELVTVRGKRYPVQEHIHVGSRDYLILKRLSGPGRQRFMALDPLAGPEGEVRVLHILPKTSTTTQHLSVLSRAGQLHSTLPILLEYHPERNRVLVVTKWIWGIPLSEYLAECRAGKKPWPSPFIAISKFRKFVHGLCQIHDRLRIVHGDIHPDNIIVGSNPLNFVPIDFGTAWAEECATGREVGDGNRGHYAAPEMYDPAVTPNDLSDQFSATVILFELLTHTLPFEGLGGKAGWPEYRGEFRDYSPSVRAAVEGRGDFPRDMIAPLERIVAMGLQLDPGKRFRTGAEWRDALDDFTGDLRRGTRLGAWGAWFADFVARIGSCFSRQQTRRPERD